VLLHDVFTKSLWDSRRTLPGWTVAVVAVAAMYAAFWPTVRSPEMSKALAAYPQDLLEAFNYSNLTTVQGYLGSAVYGLLVPLLTAVFMISAGARSVAGDENAGTLDLVLAHPVSRRSLALQRFAGVLVGIAIVALALFLAFVALRVPFQLDDVAVTGFLAMNLHLALFGACFGALAFAVGAATGSKALSLGVSSAVAVLTYLANSVFPQVESVIWTRNLSPFHWYLAGEPLTNGIQPAGTLTLLAETAALATIGTLLFEHRDITS
jgi:ABC-2 type transport system permease protein